MTFRATGSAADALFLIVAKKTSHTAGKLSIVELGPNHVSHTFRIEQMTWLDIHYDMYDFPVKIICSVKLSLVYVVTKLGTLFVYDLESAVFILSQRIAADIIFEATLDHETQGIIAISRNGQVLLVELQFPEVVNHLTSGNKNVLAKRLQELSESSSSDEVTRL